MIHLTDFFPTFNSLLNAGFKIEKSIDGIDQSEILKKPFTVDRKDQLRNTIEVIGAGRWSYSAVFRDEFKYVKDSNWGGVWDLWYGTNDNVDVNADKYFDNLRKSKTWKAIKSTVSESQIEDFKNAAKVSCAHDSEVNKCYLLEKPCLFNIFDDPCEQNNLAENPKFANKLQEMKDFYNKVVAGIVPARRVAAEPRSNPVNWDGTWTWYMDLLEGKA